MNVYHEGPQRSKDIDLIVFDLDGTLVDSRLDIVISVNYMLGKLGLQKKCYEEVLGNIGLGVRHLIRATLGKENMHFFDRGFSIFKKHYRRHILDNTYLYPHVDDVLKYFASKTKIIITNKSSRLTRKP